MEENKELVTYLEKRGALINSLVKKALLQVGRRDFVPDEYKNLAYEDIPLPIGFDQTISQPTTVVFMLELLDPKKGENILDIGSGSAWTTALLAKIVGESGYVTGLERIAELVDFGKRNLANYNFSNVEIKQGQDISGTLSKDLYDRILVSASAQNFPYLLKDQLKTGGVLVVPVGNSIVKATKNKDGTFEKNSYYGFSFVPLLGY